MDETQKNVIRIKHWLTHNKDHISGYMEAAAQLEKAGHSKAAEHLKNGIELVKKADEAFEAALGELPSTPDTEEHHHHHHHDHSHSH
jgi:hypothetical protein